MTRVTNPLLMLIPEEAMGPALALLIVVGGLMTVVGARRAGLALVGTAIALPLITVIVEMLMNQVFDAVPEWMIQPLAWLLMGLAYLMLATMLIVMLVGKESWETAKGQLVADAIKGLVRLVFWWPAMLLWVTLVAYFAFRAS